MTFSENCPVVMGKPFEILLGSLRFLRQAEEEQSV